MHSGFITNQLKYCKPFFYFYIADYGLQLKKTLKSYLIKF